jgi:hypothetical protein
MKMSNLNDSNSTADNVTDSQSQFIQPLINDFDLDVVDEAMLHPEKPEYIDHFGFKVQVKTDTEYAQDTSESEDEFEDASSLKSDSVKSKGTAGPQEDDSINITQANLKTTTIEGEPAEGEKINTMEDWHLISSVEKLDPTNSSSETSSVVTDSSKPNNTSYYDIFLSKFSRLGNQDSVKQAQLKQETSHNLELLKKESSTGDTDWGKLSMGTYKNKVLISYRVLVFGYIRFRLC